MFKQKRIIPESHRGLLFKNEQFQQVLNAGIYHYFSWQDNYRIETISLNTQMPQAVDDEYLHLLDLHPQAFNNYIMTWQTQAYEVGLVYQDNVLKAIHPPAQRGAYWQGSGLRPVTIKTINIADDFYVKPELARLLQNTSSQPLCDMSLQALSIAAVPEGHLGFLTLDGTLQPETLAQGTHTWWRFNRHISVSIMDLRVQNMEVNGQEILTKDRVSLRINLSATWQVSDALKIKQHLSNHMDYLYRELQLALRSVVSTQTLDELLADKNSLNQAIQTIVANKVAEFGLQLNSVGARDIILPSDMKMILSQVVEAQKVAEANLIKRREETQATRSLHNTAKVMENNPTLLRLKELEVLEKITTQIDTLNVYGGLNSVMHELVSLKQGASHDSS